MVFLVTTGMWLPDLIPLDSKGTAAGEVTSSNRGAYPDNNYSENYWYVFAQDKITYTQGSYVADVEADEPNTYPDNGRHTDGYWYVKQPE